MTKWIEVRTRYSKLNENGVIKTVAVPYLVDALSCTEAEARVTEELTPYIKDEFLITSVVTTKISEIFWDNEGVGDRFYKVKVNFITIDDKTATEKRSATYILVQASGFEEAYRNFLNGMKGTIADFEIESICETRIADVFTAATTA